MFWRWVWTSKWLVLLCLILFSCRTEQATIIPPVASMSTAVFIGTPFYTATAIPTPSLTPTLASTAVPSKTPTPPAALIVSPTRLPSYPQLTLTPENVPWVIGDSYEGRPIYSYRFGNGPLPIIIVGGIHGGYEWNTILLAYEAIDYFQARPEAIPLTVTLIIIPGANPDGQFAVTKKEGRFTVQDIQPDTIPGRFNGGNVDLNRNWDCQWSKIGVWRDQSVNGGDQPFSEPESRALRDFILTTRPVLVIFWHSAANGVFAAGCPETFAPSLQFAQIYGDAAGYPAYERFQYYMVTGDAGDWLATQGIPSISVELKNHSDIQWLENLSGIADVLTYLNESFAHPPCQSSPAGEFLKHTPNPLCE